jgi:hypothetical protein
MRAGIQRNLEGEKVGGGGYSLHLPGPPVFLAIKIISWKINFPFGWLELWGRFPSTNLPLYRKMVYCI